MDNLKQNINKNKEETINKISQEEWLNDKMNKLK